MARLLLLVLIASYLGAGCAGSPEPILACDASEGERPICGFQNPEDLVLAPDARSLIVSEFGGMDGGRPGLLSRLDLESERRSVLFRGGEAQGDGVRWGDPDCPGPPGPMFSPHGLHLSRRSDGAHQLLVVEHGERESVEFFEVSSGAEGVALAWRGCAVAPAHAWFNDVVATPEGGFLVTHVMPRRSGMGQLWEFARAGLFAAETGGVHGWAPGEGFTPLSGAGISFANGIELSPDGRTAFVNASTADRVHRIDRETGRRTGSALVRGPDNSTWAEDGRLWVASFTGRLGDVRACGELERGACPIPFEIVAVDPDTLETQLIYAGGGPPMGGGTVGLQVGPELFVGSFAGDRVLRVTLRREGD